MLNRMLITPCILLLVFCISCGKAKSKRDDSPAVTARPLVTTPLVTETEPAAMRTDEKSFFECDVKGYRCHMKAEKSILLENKDLSPKEYIVKYDFSSCSPGGYASNLYVTAGSVSKDGEIFRSEKLNYGKQGELTVFGISDLKIVDENPTDTATEVFFNEVSPGCQLYITVIAK